MPRLIDADRAMEYIDRSINEMTKIGIAVNAEYLWALINNAIYDAPTVDAEPVRHGHWTEKRNPMMYQLIPYVWVCDQCGTAFYYKTPYCGECGAKMDEEEK